MSVLLLISPFPNDSDILHKSNLTFLGNSLPCLPPQMPFPLVGVVGLVHSPSIHHHCLCLHYTFFIDSPASVSIQLHYTTLSVQIHHTTGCSQAGR